ncbi:hypothetical protein [Thaumasiovibrio sp. DFM-14]|uniref:hypothetical protein n=1 Tax=Thaumasiovibrio sp. DFM-14 TaxID=3384792 RepID=UPI0039A13E07
MNDQQRLGAAEKLDIALQKSLSTVTEAEKNLLTAWLNLSEHYAGLGAEETEQAYRQLSVNIEQYKEGVERLLVMTGSVQQELNASTQFKEVSDAT